LHIRYLQGIGVIFVYECYRVQVKVTGATKAENSYFRNVELRSAITPLLQKNRSVRFECSMRFSGMADRRMIQRGEPSDNDNLMATTRLQLGHNDSVTDDQSVDAQHTKNVERGLRTSSIIVSHTVMANSIISIIIINEKIIVAFSPRTTRTRYKVKNKTARYVVSSS